MKPRRNDSIHSLLDGERKVKGKEDMNTSNEKLRKKAIEMITSMTDEQVRALLVAWKIHDEFPDKPPEECVNLAFEQIREKEKAVAC